MPTKTDRLDESEKALIMMASSGIYDGEMASYDHALTLVEQKFRFMGFENVKMAAAGGMEMYRDKIPKIIAEAQQKVKTVVQEWYG